MLVAEASQQRLPLLDVLLALHPERLVAVYHAEYGAPIADIGQNHLYRVRGRAEDGADLLRGLDRRQNVDRESVAQKDQERVSGGDAVEVACGQLHELLVGAGASY